MKNVHKMACDVVRAKAQSEAAHRVEPMLQPDELEMFRRGRNAKGSAPPKGVSVGEYRVATGLEALFGFLYLTGQQERLQTLLTHTAGEALSCDENGIIRRG